MGYIIAVIIAAFALVLLFVAFGRGRSRPVGRTAPRHDVTVKEPSASETTPGASAITSEAENEAARQRTPPA